MKYNGLKGDGFIALPSDDPASNFMEHDTLEEAQAWAALKSGGKSVYVIYAPVAIVRPRIATEVETTVIGADMLKQLGAGKKR